MRMPRAITTVRTSRWAGPRPSPALTVAAGRSTSPPMSDTEKTSVDGTLRRVAATDAEKGWRLDRFLATKLPDLSRSRLQSLIEAGAVAQGGATIGDANRRIKPGEIYEIAVPPPLPAEPAGQ
ncbi:MAG: hypothetical protein KGQ94_12715, partial [Alphaproteobacteria bacterium]|nr:hypothetical protein [Alphaproteobacteria bacterium]